METNKLDSLGNLHIVKCMECGCLDEAWAPDDAYLCADCEDATYFCPDCMEVGSDCTCAYCQHCSNMEEDCDCPTCAECGLVVYECSGCDEMEYTLTDIYPTKDDDIPF